MVAVKQKAFIFRTAGMHSLLERSVIFEIVGVHSSLEKSVSIDLKNKFALT